MARPDYSSGLVQYPNGVVSSWVIQGSRLPSIAGAVEDIAGQLAEFHAVGGLVLAAGGGHKAPSIRAGLLEFEQMNRASAAPEGTFLPPLF